MYRNNLFMLAWISFLAGAVACGTPARGIAETLEYNRDIRPILAEYCFACHGPDSAARKADLRLDLREAAIEYGAISPGKPNQSELVTRIDTDDAELLMPPPETKKQLSPRERDILKRWIASGAEYQPHWAFIRPTRAELPAVRDQQWSKNAIDRFVLAKLEAQGLSPAPEADPRTLFRRLHLDITGLPPQPRDMASFLEEYSRDREATLSRWIDHLMATPAWGEHRARYWLDAARYGDTHGLHFDNYREMWPYRDWVIRAFNANQPFDQFTIEQLAGDLLPEPTESQLIATGFQRCNITTNEGGTIDEENLALYATDRVQTFGWVFLGLTTNCSQCHDHKFDPFTMRDYYSLAAYFRNTTQKPKDGNVKDGRGPVLVVPSEADRNRWLALPAEIAQAKSARDKHRNSVQPEFEQWLAQATPALLLDQLPDDGLILHLPLNEGSGNRVANRVQSTQTFAVEQELVWEPGGQLGPAPLVKSGNTFDLGEIGDFEKNQSFSVAAWIRPARGDASAAIAARMDERNAYRGWDLWQQGGSVGMHLIDTWPENALKVVTTDAVLKPGQWQHVCATYDGSGKTEGIKIYVDGQLKPVRVEKNSLKPEATFRTPTPLRLGQRSHGQAFEGGAIQDFRLFTRLLNSTEALQLFETVQLQHVLAIPQAQRSPDQQKKLREYYLIACDATYPGLEQQVRKLEAEQNAIRDRSPVTHIQTERPNTPAMANILKRGEYDQPLEEVAANTPAALHPLPENAPPNRVGLAQWLVDPANPLTARVTVNRFWQQVFGQGLVVTAEDFGVMGAPPSHPELLDWLALEFQESGWDVRHLFKQMLMSATYRQAAVVSADALERDRDNHLLSRGPRYRMDAEMLRDYALASSDLLVPTMYGPGVKPYQPEDIWSIVGLPGGNTRNYVQDTGDNLYRRSLYTFWKRMAPPPNMEAFNAPSREVCTIRRERTNTPLQALVTLNDPQFIEAARNVAQRGLPQGSREPSILLNLFAERVLGRPLHAAEIEILLGDLREYQTYYNSHPDDAQALISIGESKFPEQLAPTELAAWTMICNQLLNLDEALNK